MKHSVVVLALGWWVLWGSSAGASTLDPARRSPAVDPNFAAPKFTVPDGFEVDLIAGPPLVHHPIMAGFDDRGRLFVAETTGENLKNDELDEKTPAYMTLLEDTDGDGLFDRSIRFADNLTFPQGALWHDGALYVSSPPGLWVFRDTDGDGKADERKQLAAGYAYTGNAADVHGPFLHPNGRLYWCHGRKGHEVYQNGSGELISKGKGARIWSIDPRTRQIEVHAGGGMDNPVEVVFTPEGDILGSVNLFYGRPRGDVLVHWQYGGAYPRHDQQTVVAEFKRTGELLEEVENFGHVAVSGLTRYRSGGFGAEYAGNIFLTLFNTHKVTRTILEREGSTFRSVTEDFIEAHSENVHFTDVLEDADGSLVLIDTGGWFRIGCPASQIAKPELRGAIYRITKRGVERPGDPHGTGLAWADASAKALVGRLDDDRFAVRDRAVAELAGRGDEVVKELKAALEGGTPRTRRNAVWALTRIGSKPGARAIRRALKDESASVRQAACHGLGRLRDRGAGRALVARLGDEDPFVRREAAAALGRIGDGNAIPALLEALTHDTDRTLEHALIYALIEIGHPDSTVKGLAGGEDGVVRGALIALDQMDGGKLEPSQVTSLLGSASAEIQGPAVEIAARRENWAPELAKVFQSWLDDGSLTDPRLEALTGIVPRQLGHASIQQVVTRLLTMDRRDSAVAALGPKLIGASSGVGLNPDWKQPLEAMLQADDVARAGSALNAISALNTRSFDEALKAIGQDESRPALIRVKALTAVSVRNSRLDGNSFELLMSLLSPEVTPSWRGEAAGMLARAKLSQAQALKLAEAVAQAGPLEFPVLFNSFRGYSRNREIGLALVEAMKVSRGAASVPVSEVSRLIARYPEEVRAAAAPIIETRTKEAGQQAAKLAGLEAGLPPGDPEKGRAVFSSQKALCSNCHRIARQGGLVGPDLSRIGRIRTRRDLLEAIVFPSASLSRDFEAYSIDLKDGEAHSGVILKENRQTVEIAQASGQPLKIARDRIKTITPSPLSLMPQGLDQAMTRQELADLLAYLRSLQ